MYVGVHVRTPKRGERTQFRSHGLGKNPRKHWVFVKGGIAGRDYGTPVPGSLPGWEISRLRKAAPEGAAPVILGSSQSRTPTTNIQLCS